MSQICVATKTIVSVQKYPDFSENGGVYKEAGLITSTLPGKLGNGKNAGD
jgi:hypothetical protein